MPIIHFDNLEAVPIGLKEFAKSNDESGKIEVNVVPSVKLDEFRNKNIELSQQLETAGPVLARIKEIAGDDLDAFTTDIQGLRDIAKRVQDGELRTNDQIESAVADRIKAMKDGYESNAKAQREQIVDLTTKAETFQQKLIRTQIDKDVTTVIIQPDSGVRPEALPDILTRAYSLFKVEDGKLIPKNGEAVIYGANGADAMTVQEWLVKLRDQAPHYFKGNNGGGAAGGKDGKIGGFSQEQISKMSPQAKLALANSQKK